MQPAAVGELGELYIGGDGLARGYLSRPDITAERFIPDPFASQPGARLYRTGDLGRRRPNGELEFVGRADDQVKIRGYRIELGEIELALRQHPEVAEAVVVVEATQAGDKRLVAYLVAKPSMSADPAGLRRYLAGRLPDYMLPNVFVMLERMPLSVNGKIDRRSLPAAGPEGGIRGEGYTAPRNAIEEVMAGVWAEVLERKRVGVEEDFFEMGGHSLLATRVMSRVEERFGVSLPVRLLFEYPTVAALSERVAQALAMELDNEEMAQTLAELDLASDSEKPPILSDSKVTL
jgi:acyl carrier protein